MVSQSLLRELFARSLFRPSVRLLQPQAYSAQDPLLGQKRICALSKEAGEAPVQVARKH